ncbi:MAG: uroporphyrinogen-III C-methyltransferase [Chloroflexi bacterium]|nr:uroporphyrinogen-III C-methyltransferase [Chloroflexota bacterium]
MRRPERRGLVSLVGAGPGDPGLITVKGLKRLAEADVVVYDRLASEALLSHVRPDAEQVFVGKQPGRHAYTQDGINNLLVDRAQQGKRVCRLKGGDPFVFGRGGEEALTCRDAGVDFEVVPGVTSAIAGPAYAGIPVTHRLIAASFAVITGHEDPQRSSSSIRWDHLAKGVDTLVFLMGIEHLEEITSKLMQNGRPASTPAALVEWGTYARQRTLVSTLGEIAERCKSEGFKPPCVTIVGEVVRLRDRLRWFDCRPLSGATILVTRARDRASELAAMLQEEGASVVQFPTIRIRAHTLADVPDFAALLTAKYDWTVFTSVNAVRCFFGLVRQIGGDARSLGQSKIAAVGPTTATAVEGAGLRVDFIPEESTSGQLAASFPEQLQGRRILVPRAKVIPGDLLDSFEAQGAIVTPIPVYETLPDEGAEATRQQIRSGGIDVITFTSSSTVRNFLAEFPAAELPSGVQIACIGPVTAQTARDAGLRVDIVAEQHNIDGLVEAVRVLRQLSRGQQASDPQEG